MSLETPLFQTAPLFDGVSLEAPTTEGIKYAGSKLKLIPFILQLARKTGALSVLDGFSGTTRVSQAFAKCGYQVVANDIAVWSEVFGVCYLLNKKTRGDFRELFVHLNSLTPVDGWFTQHYGGSPTASSSEKRPWQIHNTRKLDAIREEIEKLSLDRTDKCVVLAGLMLALDEVDSTLGHFASYLREWSPRSYKTFQLKVPLLVPSNEDHRVLRSHVFDALPDVSVDLAYYDPPYGSNNEKMPPSRVRYSAYYHLWTTVCLHDHPPLFGKVNRRADTSDTVAPSEFEEFRKHADGQFLAVKAIRRLLRESHAHYVILSYSSGGRATAHELQMAIEESGTLLETLEIDYKKNVMAGMKWTHQWLRDAEESNREFLFLIERK